MVVQNLQDILEQCYIFSNCSGYDFSMFQEVYREITSENLDEPFGFILFWDPGFSAARNLECVRLGRSIDEVLLTLICAKEGKHYCPVRCGCADEQQIQLSGNEQTDVTSRPRRPHPRHRQMFNSELHDLWSYVVFE